MSLALASSVILAIMISGNNLSIQEIAIPGWNSNNLSQFPKNLVEIATLLAGIAAAIGIPITVITFYFQRKQQNLNSLIEVFKLLNDKDHRAAREDVYNAYKEYSKGTINVFNTDSMKKQIAIVRADFNQVGTLLYRKLIPKQALLEEYWNTILICWIALENHVQDERIMRRYPTYMQNFERLKNEARVYWKKHHPEVREVKIYELTVN